MNQRYFTAYILIIIQTVNSRKYFTEVFSPKLMYPLHDMRDEKREEACPQQLNVSENMMVPKKTQK